MRPSPLAGLDITLRPAGDLASIGPDWQALHARAGGSFFQSWCWVGCRAEARFPDPVLLEAFERGRRVALGLFNRRAATVRRGATAWLGESGDPALDDVFVEHNGLLVDHPDRAAAVAACLRVAVTGLRHVVLSGVDRDHAAAPAGASRVRMVRLAPWRDLTRDPFDGISANTRHQLRRSARAYAAQGPLSITRAATVAEAQGWLDALTVLHQASWRRRGRPGAFANPEFGRFHHALVARGHESGQVDLLRVAAGAAVVGYLLNFVEGGRVCAYQSGFDYPAAGPHQKPGLTCHHLAIGMYAAAGRLSYDFLAGADRYKTSLATDSQPLHWLELAPPWSARGLAYAARRGARLVLRRPDTRPDT